MKVKYLLIVLLAVFGSLNAVEIPFRYVCEIQNVDSSRFYKIQLNPKIVSKVKSDKSDLRLYDANGSEVPFLQSAESDVYFDSTFVEYEIVSKQLRSDSITEIIYRKNDNEKIDNVSVLIGNAEASKHVKLTGSFDRIKWFIVKESQLINSVDDASDVSEMKVFNFPLTNYKYYKIEIDDRNSEPLDIIKIGRYNNWYSLSGQYTSINSSFNVTDSVSKKTSWVKISLDDTMLIDKFELKIEKPEYYVRNAELMIQNADSSFTTKSLVLNSKLEHSFSTGGVRTSLMWIRIENGDNQPLKVSEIKCFQLNHYLIAKLEKGNSYKLRFGNDSIRQPDYDLKYFKSVVPADITTIQTKEITDFGIRPRSETIVKPDFFSDKRFIWGALIVVILLLGIVTFRMMRNIKN